MPCLYVPTMKLHHKHFFIFFLFLSNLLLSQQKEKIITLDEKINENRDLALVNPEQYFYNIEELLEEAVRTNDKRSELRLLGQRCWYYNRKMDLDKSVKAINELESKALESKDIYHQALAHQYFSQIYSLNNLMDKAVSEFEKAMGLLNQLDETDQDVRYSKMNAYFTVANVYLYSEDYEQVVKVLLKANQEIENFDNEELKQQMLFLNYSNLGIAYENFDTNSAEHFARKSIKMKLPGQENSTSQFQNYMVLGSIYKTKHEYAQAIYNYKKAESIIPIVKPELLNIEEIYHGLSEIYNETDSAELAVLYTQKLNKVQLEMEKSKNKSLHTIIENKMMEDRSMTTYIAVGLSAVIIILLGVIVYFRSKNKLLLKQEKMSQEYLEERQKEPKDQEYTQLIEMLQNNDPAFLVSFHEIFPGFIDKLKGINDKIVSTEVEFCALLKLNLSTKEIAKFKNIEPKSVQTRKHRIRKKLNIPDNEDIYFWFNQI